MLLIRFKERMCRSINEIRDSCIFGISSELLTLTTDFIGGGGLAGGTERVLGVLSSCCVYSIKNDYYAQAE